MNTIKSIEPDVTSDVFMFRFKIRLENRGTITAEGFQANLNGPLPITYIHASGNQGIDNGKLKSKQTYELNGYYTFESKEKMDEFIEQSSISIDWNDNEIKKKLNIKFPSKPTQEGNDIT